MVVVFTFNLLNWEEQACVHGGSDTIGESVDLRFNIPTVHA